MKAVKVTTDNDISVIDIDSMDDDYLAKVLECDEADEVHIEGFPEKHSFSRYDERTLCMVYDVEGTLDKTKKENAIATELLDDAIDSITYTICGDVLFVAEESDDLSYFFVELTDTEISGLLKGLELKKKLFS